MYTYIEREMYVYTSGCKRPEGELVGDTSKFSLRVAERAMSRTMRSSVKSHLPVSDQGTSVGSMIFQTEILRGDCEATPAASGDARPSEVRSGRNLV